MVERWWTSTGVGCRKVSLKYSQIGPCLLPKPPQGHRYFRWVEGAHFSIRGVLVVLPYWFGHDTFLVVGIGRHCCRQGGVRQKWWYCMLYWRQATGEPFASRLGSFPQSAWAHCHDQSWMFVWHGFEVEEVSVEILIARSWILCKRARWPYIYSTSTYVLI